MSKVDIILLAILLFFGWLGYRQGIVRMGMAILGIGVSVAVLQWKWGEAIQLFYFWNIQNPYVLLLFMLVFIAITTGICVLVSNWLERFFKLIFLNWLNKLAGMFLAVVFGFFLVSLMLIVGTSVPQGSPIIFKNQLGRSVFAQFVFAIDQYTPLRTLVLRNFQQTNTPISESPKEM